MEEKIPKTFEEAIEILFEANNTPENVLLWGRLDERDAVGMLHFGTGIAIRNTWGLWEDNELTRWFKQKGITHADDMSGILLTSVYRKFNSLPLDLEGQIKEYQDYWKKNGFPDGIPK